jgi:probable O-glycosylation ligase (exosortase A-associated)
MWYAISYGVPHHLAFGFAYTFPFAQIVGLITLVAWLLSREPKRIPIGATAMLLVAFGMWICVTMVFAVAPDIELWRRTIIQVGVALLALGIINTPDRLHRLAVVTALSIGFYGVKGGLAGVVTAGGIHLHGPEDSPIEDNNALAIALLMAAPLLFYMYLEARQRLLRHMLRAALILNVVAVLVTYSRGGLVALGAILLYGWCKSNRKTPHLLVLAAVAATIAWFMPEDWYARMQSIGEYETDQSAAGRYDAWQHALNVVAVRPLVGAGFGTFTRDVFAEFSPGLAWRAAHSIYFECLGEHGIIGLGLFLALIISAFLDARWVLHRTKGRPEFTRLRRLAGALQVSLVAYVVGGTLLSLTYIELIYGIIMIAARLKHETAVALARGATDEATHPIGPVGTRPTNGLLPAG